jgi:hypothetical protein
MIAGESKAKKTGFKNGSIQINLYIDKQQAQGFIRS